jgi:hypothetical protein
MITVTHVGSNSTSKDVNDCQQLSVLKYLKIYSKNVILSQCQTYKV